MCVKFTPFVFLFKDVCPRCFFPFTVHDSVLRGAAAHSFYDHAMELTLTNEVGLTDVPAEVGEPVVGERMIGVSILTLLNIVP